MGIFKTIAKGAVFAATAATTSLGGNGAKHYVQSKGVQSHRSNNPVQRMVQKPSSGINIKGKK
jgi:hypothetical protein